MNLIDLNTELLRYTITIVKLVLIKMLKCSDFQGDGRTAIQEF